MAPAWPEPWGLNASVEYQLVIDEELRRANAHRPINPIGIGWAGPTIVVAGTEEQKARWLPPLLSGEEFWCQLFSEPNAGSDLASLADHGEARRRRVGDHRSKVVDELRASRDVGHLVGSHVERRSAPERHLVLRVFHEFSGSHRSPARRYDRRSRLQRGVLRRGSTPAPTACSATSMTAGVWPR